MTGPASASEREPRTTGSRQLAPLVALLAIVFAIKLIVVWQLKDHPMTQPEVGLDTSAYVELARRAAAGDWGLGPGLYYVSPLYIYFLAAILVLTKSFTAVRVLQIALGTAAVALLWLTSRTWFNTRAAYATATLAALTGLFTFYESLLLQASLDVFLTSAALYLLTRVLTTPRPWFEIATGVVFGIATLNRPNMLIAAIALAAVLVAARRGRAGALLIAGVLAGMSPVAMRNAVVAGTWSFTSSHGGLNLYIGNSETATGFYHSVPGITPTIAGQQKDAQRVAAGALGHPVSEAEASSYFTGLALTWMREHPGSAVALLLKKAFYAFHAQHVALPYSYPFYAYDAGTILGWLFVGPWLLIPLGVAGLILVTPTPPRAGFWIWASFVPMYAGAVALFFVAERYRLPLMVPLCVGAGAMLDAVAGWVVARRWQALAAPAACVTAIAIAANWPLGLHDGRWEEGLRMAQRLVILGRYSEADDWTRRLETNPPRKGMAEHGVGMQMLVVGRPEKALPHLEQAHVDDPSNASIEYALGVALLRVNRTADALPHLTRGFAGNPDVPMAGYDLAMILKERGDFAAAAEVLSKVTVIPDNPEDWLRLGRLATEVKALDVAEPFFRHAAEMSPALASARQQYGLNLLLLGRFADGARELREASRLDPRDPDSLAHLAYCELRLNQLADARAHAAAALAIAPDHPLATQVMQAVKQRDE